MATRASGYGRNVDPAFALYEMMKAQDTKEGSAVFCCVDSKYVPVTALIDREHIGEWRGRSAVQPGAEILIKDKYQVTARVATSQMEALTNEKWVHNLRVAETLSSTGVVTAQDIAGEIGLTACESQHRAHGRIKDDGDGVVIGVIDFSGDFNHRHFQWIAPGGMEMKTRLISLWNQQGIPVDGDDPVEPAYNYGRHYSHDQINDALHASDPHDHLDYHPEKDAHGTHVMSIAAQMAPMAKLIFVDLGYLPSASGSRSGPVGDSIRVIEAIHYIFERAKGAPCVVNLSLGSYMGGHDGTAPVEYIIDAMVKAAPNRAVVVSAANAFVDKTHAMGTVTGAAPTYIEWKFPPAAYGLQRMQIWYPRDAELSLSITNETGDLLEGFQIEQPADILDRRNNRVGMVWHKLSEDVYRKKCHRDTYFDIWRIVDKVGFSGDKWELSLKVKTGDNVRYDAWIERFDEHQSVFADPVTACTLGSIATGFRSVVVGSYDATTDAKPISYFSSAGPTRDERLKPDTSAPGQLVRAAKSNTESGLVDMSGTSMAAPVVTGVIARMLSLAHSQGNSLNHKEISERVKTLCRTNHGGVWDPQFGWGKVSAEMIYQGPVPGGQVVAVGSTTTTTTTTTTTGATTLLETL